MMESETEKERIITSRMDVGKLFLKENICGPKLRVASLNSK